MSRRSFSFEPGRRYVATGTITWIDSVRGCCFIASDVPGRDLYVDQAEVDSRSAPLYADVWEGEGGAFR